jgi:sortase A
MKIKKLVSAVIAAGLSICAILPVSAYNYIFESGADYSNALGNPTSTDEIVAQNPEKENIRRNKDAAYLPPPFGVFSGDIPTDPSSLYHDNSKPHSGVSDSSVYAEAEIGGSISPDNAADYGGLLPPTSTYSVDILSTQPLYYDDGSIGTLTIPALNLTVKVFEGETLENMKNGIGHFEFTSAWNGNICMAGHNRGVPAAIGGVKNLTNGDTVVYETKYGTRTYEVYNKQQISDTDYSVLGWSDENILTIITCVEGISNLRLAVQCKEVT